MVSTCVPKGAAVICCEPEMYGPCCARRVVELAKSFDEQVTSVALHPTGLFLLVGFADRLRMLSILMDDLK